MPYTSAFKILGMKNVEQFNTGGGSLYLFPPPLNFTPSTASAAKEAMSLWLWKDAARQEINEWLKPWCTLSSDGLKLSFKQQKVEFNPNDGPKVSKLTGTYEEAKLTFDALDIALSPVHYIDLMGDQRLVDYFAKPPGTDSRAGGTLMTTVGPTKLARKVYLAYVSLGHPEFEDRCSVVWFYGELAADIEGEFSISNPVKGSVTVECYEFPKFRQPNGLPAYFVLEAPVAQEPSGW